MTVQPKILKDGKNDWNKFITKLYFFTELISAFNKLYIFTDFYFIFCVCGNQRYATNTEPGIFNLLHLHCQVLIVTLNVFKTQACEDDLEYMSLVGGVLYCAR